MRENAWRSKLVARLAGRKDVFVWVNEVRAKAGFPDLTLVLRNGTKPAISAFYELKVAQRIPRRVEALFDPLQLHTMRRLGKVGARVMGLVRLELERRGDPPVLVYDPVLQSYRLFPAPEFYDRWTRHSADDDVVRPDA